jgi:hypothetical protein
MTLTSIKNRISDKVLVASLIAADFTDIIGTIEKPPGVDNFDTPGAPDQIGVLNFFSALLQVATIIAGLYVLLNFILAGYEYITSGGDTGAHAKVRQNLTSSVIGLIIIAVSYTIVALLGLILFGSADFFLNPDLSFTP